MEAAGQGMVGVREVLFERDPDGRELGFEDVRYDVSGLEDRATLDE